MKETIDGCYCLLDYCDKEMIDNQPPCCDCENCISFEEFAEIQKDIQEKILKK